MKTFVCAATLLAACTFTSRAELIFATTSVGSLVSFDSANPSVGLSSVTITGLNVGETLVGIDLRPADGQIYGIGSSSQLYRLNRLNGVATAVGPMMNVALSGDFFGVDFNPRADLFRVISNTGQNLRVSPVTGLVQTNISATGDGMLMYGAGDVNEGEMVRAVATAYTNNFNSSPTTQFVIDSGLDTLNIQMPPNAGTQITQGSLGVNYTDRAGFDISGVTGIGYTSSGNNLWTVALTGMNKGQSTFIGAIIPGEGFDITDITVAPIPEPSTWAMFISGAALLGLARRRRSS